jgi:hypothetical protein
MEEAAIFQKSSEEAKRNIYRRNCRVRHGASRIPTLSPVTVSYATLKPNSARRFSCDGASVCCLPQIKIIVGVIIALLVLYVIIPICVHFT